MKKKLKNLLKKPVFLISTVVTVAAIATGCSVFNPWMVATYTQNSVGGGVAAGTVAAAGAGNISYDKVTYSAGCVTKEVGIVESATTGALVTAGTKTSTKITLVTTSSSTGSTLKYKNQAYSDAACATLKAGAMVAEFTYNYTLNNNGDNHVIKIATTATDKKTGLTTTTVSKESYAPQNLDLVLSGISLTPNDTAAATAATTLANAQTDNTGTVVASCKALTFTAGTATDITTCAKASNLLANIPGGGLQDPIITGVASLGGIVNSQQVVYDSAKKYFYMWTNSATTESAVSTLNGDVFYQ